MRADLRAARHAARAEREAARAERHRLAREQRAAVILRRVGAAKGVRARLLAGLDPETIAREIAERGDALLTWDAWLRGPVGTPAAAVLEALDGPTIYAAALALATEARAALVRAGLLAG